MIKRDEMTEEYSSEMMVSVCDRRSGFDVNSEINVPEYLPEVRRVLNLSARVQPPSKYVNGSVIECNGTVDHKLLYIGIDGNLYSVSESSDYSFSVPLDDLNGADASNGITTLIGVCVESCNARLVSQRRVGAKVHLASRVRGYASINLCEEISGSADGEMQRLVREVENVSMEAVSSELMELGEEVVGFSDDIRVIGVDAIPFVSDTKKGSGRVTADGDVFLKLLVCKDGGYPESVVRKLRFSTDIETDTNDGEYYCKVTPSVTDIAVNVDEGKISCDISMVQNVTIVNNKKTKYTEDAYFVGRECDCKNAHIKSLMAVVCANGNFTVSERVQMTGSAIPVGASVMDVWGSASFSDCVSEDGKYVFTGQGRYCILWGKDGEYGVYEVVLPIRYETDNKGAGVGSFDACADVVSARARIDADSISIDSEIAVQYDVMDGKEICAVKECRVGEGVEKKKRGIIVYYPSGEESAWDVAKKYKVCASSLVSEKNYYIM